MASPEDRITNKLEWFRLGSKISERQWKDAVGVMRVQRERLDRDYLTKWAAALGLEDPLARAYVDAGFEPTG